MKATLLTSFGDADCLQPGEIPTPEPGPGEVLLRVLSAGVNRLDLYLRRGDLHRAELPHVLGSDVVGEVVRSSEDAGRFAPGDRVIGLPGFPLDPAEADADPLSAAPSFAPVGMVRPGVYAEFVCLPERWLVPDETGLPPVEAATLPMALATCVRAVRTVGGVKAGDRVLVHAGSSGTGVFSIQVAKALGAAVVTTTRSADKAGWLRGLGADEVVDLSADGWAEAVRGFAPGGVDVAIDSLGGDLFAPTLAAVRPGGVLVAMGFVRGHEVALDVRGFFFAQQQIRGSLMGGLGDLCWGLDQVTSGRIRPVLDRVFPLAEAAAAHRHLEGPDVRGGVVLEPARGVTQ